MSAKRILILDTPNDCKSCPFSSDDCAKCKKEDLHIVNKGIRQEGCPFDNERDALEYVFYNVQDYLIEECRVSNLFSMFLKSMEYGFDKIREMLDKGEDITSVDK